MLDFSKAYVRLNELYDSCNTVNNSVEITFSFNGSSNRVYYTKQHGLYNNVLLVVDYKGVNYPISIPIVPTAGRWCIGKWIPNEIYLEIKYVLIDWKPESLFGAMAEAILTKSAIMVPYIDITKRGYYKYKSKEGLPYFETFVRVKMSSDMRSKIYSCYGDRAKEIIDFCVKRNITLRFTDDVNRSRDLYKEITI